MKVHPRRFSQTLFKAVLAGAVALSAVACSPGMFFGNDKDSKVLNTPPYRKINTDCSNMKLTKPEMDVTTFRQLVACLNSQGGLEPIERLVEQLPDSDVQSLVDVSNVYLLRDKKLVYQFDRSFQSLKDRRIVDESFAQLGRILENEEFVAAGIAVLRDKYETVQHGNTDLLKAFERLSTQIDAESVSDALDLGITLAGSKSFASLQSRFRGESPAGRSLEALTAQLLAYLGDFDPRHVDAGKALLSAIVDDGLLEALDEVTGSDQAALRAGIPRSSSVLKVSLAGNGKLMSDMSSLFHYLHKAPISCLGGSQAVEDGVMHVIRELSEHHFDKPAEYLRRGNILTLTAMNPFCSYPPELGRLYPSMLDLADTSAIGPATDLLRALYKRTRAPRGAVAGPVSRPLAELLVNLLADTGSGVPGGPAEDTAGVKRLIPVLAELNDRDAWDDLLLVATLLRQEDREPLREAIRFALAPAPELRGQSLYDVYRDAIASTSPRHLFNLIYSLRRFTDSDEPLLVPALGGLRTAFHVNDVHPVVDLARNVLRDASRNKPLFDTLFKISEMPQFQESVRHVSTMAKDGRLKELLGVVITLFQKFSQEGQMEIHETTEPAFVPKRRHDLSAAELLEFPIVREVVLDDPCRKVDLTLPMSEYTDPRFAEQVTNLLGCLDRHGQYGDVRSAIEFLRSQKTEDGRSFLDLQIDLIKGLGLTPGQMGFLFDRFTGAFDDGRLYRMLDAVPFFFNRPIQAPGQVPGETLGGGTVLEPLLELAGPLMTKAREPLRRSQEYGARVLRREDAPSLIRYFDDLWDRESEPETGADRETYDLARIARWTRAKECRGADHQPRALEVIAEYNDSVTSWDLDNGRPKKSWKYTDFRKSFEEVLQKFAKPHASDPSGRRRVYDGMLSIMRYFTLEPGQKPNRYQHYTPEQLVQWLHERATDYKLITYYYPGESAPRVRLVNSLDRLDLALLNADFNAPVIQTNFGLKFLSEIAEAWGDEPYEIWPEEIKKKYPKGKGVKSLAEVAADIAKTQSDFEGLVGFPKLPKCATTPDGEAKDPNGGGSIGWLPGMGAMKPNMYNNNQVISVIEENARNGGLKVLRDIFFEAYYSTPEEFRSPTSEENNLTIIMRTVRMGVFRQLGKNLKYFDRNDPALIDAFRALIYGSIAPETSGAFKTLLIDDSKHELLFKVIEQFFGVLGEKGADGRRELEAEHFKQLGFYLMASTGQFGIADLAVRDIAAILREHRAYLSANAGVLGKALRSRKASYLARALYEDTNLELKYHLADLLRDAMGDPSRGLDLMAIVRSVDDDAQGRKAWSRFTGRLDALLELPEYQALKLGEVIHEILMFFEETSDDPAGREAAHRIRVYLAERMESRDLDQVLLLAQRNPVEFHRALSALGREIENGDLKELLELARRSLSKPR